ncbi:MAG TPA: CDP-alcohol phosphatidyltransferase family protein [Blastocatellia bacterium]|nr:CDP-alcohol phosphatidyltransferase family protein [Blastocatellia bacterium]HMV87074.1 CDP-alcohol phosphatidyltransferase family protein [Blastocatellia bacterium]HMX24512.1 CDP-alcohol phosphatidyltransferase family protein [Blastocatellia bacterium]HMZ17342.1 CDP-alcohol phosphatidyltransferase family protein [Blastocatellia bacterium]HNG30465.1 CDP-alcohol phosphatidyltransferase family protein [Blastocatellia bacterium]
MLGGYIGDACQQILNGIVRQLARLNPNPNLLSVIGLGINILAALLYGYGRFFYAGLVMIFANIFDLLDGRVARLTGRVTRFGAFLDSSLDRLSDMVVFLGIIIFYSRDTEYHSTLYAALTGAALIGSVMVSYTSARAESLIPKCDVGFLRRPERVVLLILGSLTVWPESASPFLNKMPATIWLMAVLSYWTFAHRLFHTWWQIREIERQELATKSETAKSKDGASLRLGHDPA